MADRDSAKQFPIDWVRGEFPALADLPDRPAPIYFDAPGGTQVCRAAIRAMSAHLERGTANSGGCFQTSVETDAVSDDAHAAMADLIGGQPHEIAFGQNMTSLTLAVSRALSRDWREGDEIILSRLDHDANVTPWALAAADRGVTVRWIDFDPDTGTLNLDALPALLGPRTRLVAVGGASNAIGTLNDIPAIAAMVRANSSALLFVDAVQSVPHVPTDVAEMDCDLLACSPYKFFGPHQGVLWGRAELMERIGAYKVRPAADHPGAVRFETGTPSFESQAGVLGTIDYLEALGRKLSPGVDRRRDALIAAMIGCTDYERVLGERFLSGLARLAGARLYGSPGMDGRVPTFGFTLDGRAPDDVVAELGRNRINAWSGNFYAVEPLERLGLTDDGGLIRIGLCHYHTLGEVDRLLDLLGEIAR